MDKLHGKNRKIFKIIYKNYKKGNTISRFDMPNLCKIPKNEIELILTDLHSNGYFSYTGMHYNFILTNKGLSYFSNARHDTFEMYMKALILPVIASIITAILTTILTLWLNSLL